MQTADAVVSLNERYPAIADSVPQARKALAAFATSAGVTEEQLEGIRLVVSEAVSNAVLHAYDGDGGEIQVTAAVVPGELWILIADDGFGLRAERSGNRGLGLGLGWMAQFSDGLTLVTRSSGGLEVRLRFDLFQPAGDASDSVARVVSFC
ncbi:MAG: putative anti-sigma regulatory factor, serine/threonine protein kinase [Solirubrobacterales bacterium]|jgi:stage II sporulation protein AB (anti-sigma F factor)|nr:putative anti-sigma regulatory factor, serine/threonine protein kinase [Solirubrobacterales bacterium]